MGSFAEKQIARFWAGTLEEVAGRAGKSEAGEEDVIEKKL